MKSHSRIHFRIQSAVGHHIVFYLFAISSRTHRTAGSTPIKSHTVEITGIRTLQTASTTANVTTPVIIPNFTAFCHTILVDGSIVVRQPTFRESTVGIRGKVFSSRINEFRCSRALIRPYGEVNGLWLQCLKTAQRIGHIGHHQLVFAILQRADRYYHSFRILLGHHG